MGVDNVQVATCRELKVLCEVEQRAERQQDERVELALVMACCTAYLFRSKSVVALGLEVRVAPYRHQAVGNIVLLEQRRQNA